MNDQTPAAADAADAADDTTAYLLRDPAGAKRLVESLERARRLDTGRPFALQMADRVPWMASLSSDSYREECARALMDALADGDVEKLAIEASAWKESALLTAAGYGQTPTRWYDRLRPRRWRKG